MSRRSALPGAAELFRSTGGGPADRAATTDEPGSSGAGPSGDRSSSEGASPMGLEAPTRAERLLAEPRSGPAETRDPDGASARDDGRTRRSGGAPPEDGAGSAAAGGRKGAAASPATGGRVPTGRERHDEKITVYVSVAELMDLERARLTLRGDHGLAVDRGRIVREALAVVLADLAAEGESSTLVRRLRSR